LARTRTCWKKGREGGREGGREEGREGEVITTKKKEMSQANGK
jgi:hypothetical protein